MLKVPVAWLIPMGSRSWSDALAEFFVGRSEPISLAELYEFFAADPKSKRNRHYKAKLRQTLQRGQYRRVAPGVWQRLPN